jgi:hypothetical protein
VIEMTEVIVAATVRAVGTLEAAEAVRAARETPIGGLPEITHPEAVRAAMRPGAVAAARRRFPEARHSRAVPKIHPVVDQQSIVVHKTEAPETAAHAIAVPGTAAPETAALAIMAHRVVMSRIATYANQIRQIATLGHKIVIRQTRAPKIAIHRTLVNVIPVHATQDLKIGARKIVVHVIPALRILANRIAVRKTTALATMARRILDSTTAVPSTAIADPRIVVWPIMDFTVRTKVCPGATVMSLVRFTTACLAVSIIRRMPGITATGTIIGTVRGTTARPLGFRLAS